MTRFTRRVREGYFLGFRFYGPQKAYYDRAWTPSDVEKIN
jgi:hypothetical protein